MRHPEVRVRPLAKSAMLEAYLRLPESTHVREAQEHTTSPRHTDRKAGMCVVAPPHMCHGHPPQEAVCLITHARYS